MLTKKSIVASVVLLMALLVSACDDSPTAPSPPPAPAPAPAPRLPVSDVWNITARLSSASGGECVGEAMQSEIGLPKSYSLSITRTGNTVDATLKSASGDYDCTFSGLRGDSDGFEFGPTGGYFSCNSGGLIHGFECAGGVHRDMEALGQTLYGRISGSDISGTWNISWVITPPGERFVEIAAFETMTKYTGSR